MRQMTFKPQKAVEASLFVVSKLENPTIHEVLKMLYFADKFHLEEYGFLALGDTYFAMEFGPVAECTYDIFKCARGDATSFHSEEIKSAANGALTVSRNDDSVVALREPNLDLLSRSFMVALDGAVDKHRGLAFGERTALSHDAAWEAAWQRARLLQKKRARMLEPEIARTLDNADQVLEHMAGGRH